MTREYTHHGFHGGLHWMTLVVIQVWLVTIAGTRLWHTSGLSYCSMVITAEQAYFRLCFWAAHVTDDAMIFTVSQSTLATHAQTDPCMDQMWI